MRQRLFLVVLLVGGMVGAYCYRDLFDPLQLELWTRRLGVGGMVGFVLLYAVATVLFLPGSILTLAGGAIFGPWLGGLLSLLGATLGAGLSFLIARYLAGEWVARRTRGNLGRLLAGVESEGWIFVAFVRLVPIFPFNVLNYALGVTRIRFDHYLLTSGLCMAPGGLAYAWVGYAGKEVIGGSAQAVQAGTWALGMFALVFLISRWVRRSRHEKSLSLEQ
ncbi:MAG: VTT domain-containing protein [Magnetococcus sp. DMHC-6]